MSARFKPGDAVTVRRADPIGHVRAPHYVRGKSGRVERICGEFANPEELAFGRSGLPRRPLYRITFYQQELWPDYRGSARDTVDVEIYEHWLEPERGA